MRIIKVIRIYVTKGQRRILEQEQRTANWYETKRILPDWKDTRPSLKLVHSRVLQNVT